MKKRGIIALLIVGLMLCLACCGDNTGKADQPLQTYNPPIYQARFMLGLDKSEAETVTGSVAVGGDVLYDCQQLTDGIVVKPEKDPQRAGYDFTGWYTDRTAKTEFDFTTAIEGGITLYAGWKRSVQQEQVEEYIEPTIEFKPEIDTAQEHPVVVKRVLGELVDGNKVYIAQAAFDMLKNLSDVKDKISVSLSGEGVEYTAVYENNAITVSSGEYSTKITIFTSNKWTVSENSNYESKAKKYEEYQTAAGSIVLAGSSSMENWSTSTEDTKPLTTINVGIGGTTVEQWSEKLAHRLIYKHNPRAVVFYVGINNIINAGDNGSQTGNKLHTLMGEVHKHLPEAHVYYVLINYVPGYMNKKADIDQANKMITEYAAKNSWLTLIDAGSSLVKPNGIPNSAYFLSDGLHMSICGYSIWGNTVKQTIIETERVLYK